MERTDDRREPTMGLTFSEDLLLATGMTERELRVEVAVMLFAKDKLTMEQAAGLSGMPRLNFQHLLASRDICIHYDVEDFEDDLRTLRELGRL